MIVLTMESVLLVLPAHVIKDLVVKIVQILYVLKIVVFLKENVIMKDVNVLKDLSEKIVA